MKHKFLYQMLLLFIVSASFLSCSKSAEEEPYLTVSVQSVSFMPDGGISEPITIAANSKWTITNSASSWLQLSKSSGIQGTEKTAFTASVNNSGFSRSAVLTVTADNGQARLITITQTANLYPSYNTSPKAPDAAGMSSTASVLAAKMTLGINIGNTMEALGGETAWGNEKITEDYIKFLKNSGFTAVRIPCSWVNGYLSDASKMKIDQAWLSRVKDVVQYCVNNDMYVILNIHWDGGWLDENITQAKKEVTNAKQKALWEQIATTMRDFDEHLIFAGSNEPPADDVQEMEILNSYHETFIKAVRETGGKNSYRTLVVQGPSTNAGLSYELMNKIPYDPVPNRLMVEVHEYTPSQFCFLDEDVSWGKMVFYWGSGNHSTLEPDRNPTYGEEDAILESFRKLKDKFVSKGIPVVLGEYAAMRRTVNGKHQPKDVELHNKSVDYWTTFVTRQCKINGVVPFYWEVGNVIDRKNNSIRDQAMVTALKEGIK